MEEWDEYETTDDIPDSLKVIEGYPSEWETIKDYPQYEASIYGEIYSKRKEDVLASGIDPGGYLRVVLCDENGMHTKKVHRLVAETFIFSSRKFFPMT